MPTGSRDTSARYRSASDAQPGPCRDASISTSTLPAWQALRQRADRLETGSRSRCTCPSHSPCPPACHGPTQLEMTRQSPAVDHCLVRPSAGFRPPAHTASDRSAAWRLETDRPPSGAVRRSRPAGSDVTRRLRLNAMAVRPLVWEGPASAVRRQGAPPSAVARFLVGARRPLRAGARLSHPWMWRNPTCPSPKRSPTTRFLSSPRRRPWRRSATNAMRASTEVPAPDLPPARDRCWPDRGRVSGAADRP